MTGTGTGQASLTPRRIGVRPVIRVVTPCGSIQGHITALNLGIKTLEAANCEVRWDHHRGKDRWRAYLAGSDELRAEELKTALIEDGVDIIWIGRGGSGGARIVETVLSGLAPSTPRIIVGFSDATSILNAVSDRWGWTSFHGPVVTSFGRSSPACDVERCLAVLRGEVTKVPFPLQDLPNFSGRLRGGNLTVMASMIGSSIGPQPGPRDVWFFEDVQEAPYRLDRCLWQLRQSGCLNGIQGVLLGDFDLSVDDQLVIAGMFRDELNVPVVTGFPAGHRGRLEMVPIGAEVSVEPSKGLLWSQEGWVKP